MFILNHQGPLKNKFPNLCVYGHPKKDAVCVQILPVREPSGWCTRNRCNVSRRGGCSVPCKYRTESVAVAAPSSRLPSPPQSQPPPPPPPPSRRPRADWRGTSSSSVSRPAFHRSHQTHGVSVNVRRIPFRIRFSMFVCV